MGWRGEQAIVSRSPNPSLGYYAGSPVTGSGGMGQAVAGAGQFAAGNGITVGGATWHPTVVYLIAMVVAEMVVFGWISRALR
jgi:hypothetical protein